MDCFNGYELPAGVLLENGEITLGPVKGTDAINSILHKIGVCKWNGKDELDSLGLKLYGRI